MFVTKPTESAFAIQDLLGIIVTKTTIIAQVQHIKILTFTIKWTKQYFIFSAIRSGNWVGFDSQCHNDCDNGPGCFISCANGDAYCWMKGVHSKSEKFKIVSKDQNKYISNGETIGLYWGNGWWFGCDCSGWCWNRECPGKKVWLCLKTNSQDILPILFFESQRLKRKYLSF